MKKVSVIFIILAILFLLQTDSAFAELSNEPEIKAADSEEEMFAPVDLDLTDYTYLNKENKKFKLTAEKEGKPSYTKNTGQIWDEDKLFRYNFYSDESNLRVLPSYGSLGAYVSRQLDDNTSVMIGQDGLSSINGNTVNFNYENYSYYSSGARIDGEHKYANYSVGAFNETDTLNQQLAAVVTTKPTSILHSKGKFYIGGGVFSKLMSDVNFNTTGAFAQYDNNRFSFGAQLSNSAYSKSGYDSYNKAHFLTQYKVNNHLTLKNKLVNNLSTNELHGELGIVFNPMSDTDRLQFEVTAANYQSQNVVTRQRLKFSTSFKF